MKLKRSISLLLARRLSFCDGGDGFGVADVQVRGNEGRTEHACCCHCLHVADLPAAAGGEMRAPCCGNHHSTEIELYVSSSFDNNERYTRCIVLDLPPALAAECPCPAHVPFLREKVAERRTPFRPGSLDTLRRLPRSSRIGLRLLRDRCRVRRSVISFNQ